MIKAKNLSFKYGDRTILKNINLDIKQGELNVVIGPSGAGKTTLLKLLTLLERSETGTLEVNGDSYKFPIDKTEKIKLPYPTVNVSFQQQFLWTHLTLKENMMLVYQNVDKTKGGFTYDELVEMFNMGEFINRYPNEASLGQRQRVALARALITNPKYLFLDEITTFLDVKQIAIILDIIKKLRDRGISIFMITHYLHFIKESADKVFFIDKETIIEQGGVNILEKPKSKELKKFIKYYKKTV